MRNIKFNQSLLSNDIKTSGMKNHKLLSIALTAVLLTGMQSCVKDLDTVPLDKTVSTSATLFNNPQSYKQFLAKLYGSLSLTGQQGEFGKPEIANPDEGETSFMRQYWTAQEVTTDEAICAWGDPGLNDYRAHNWSANNRHLQLLYQRIFINIAYCNEYIRLVEPKIAGLASTEQSDVTKFVAEARFIRALNYYFALDLWGNVPFITEKDKVGAFLPRQIKRAELFTYLETELKSMIPALAAPGANEYARADQAAAYTLLAKLYLNSEVYLGAGNGKFTECIEYCNKIINSGAYNLTTDYKNLFLADNHIRREEIILPIAEDGTNSRNYGGMTFVIHAAVGGSEDAKNEFGIAAGGWNGNRLRKTMVEKFADPSGTTDKRAMFHTDKQTLEISNPVIFTQGYLFTKFKNVTSTGALGKHPMFVDTDFPLFRLADVYLMYAEASIRSGNIGNSLTYMNKLRERAYGNANGNITGGDLTLDFILDERARELYCEGHRRTDLIRFGKFTGGSYIWDWKGDVKAGTSTNEKNNLFPIPVSDIAVNTNLIQTAGY